MDELEKLIFKINEMEKTLSNEWSDDDISSVKSIMNYYNLIIPFYDYSMEEVIYKKK